jgi:hypothetical protein
MIGIYNVPYSSEEIRKILKINKEEKNPTSFLNQRVK